MGRDLRRPRPVRSSIDSREVARAIRPRRLRRPALRPCRRRGRPRHRQIRARHLWRSRRNGGARRRLSCTHDANAWPADRYAGLPAPGPGERVILWLQNSHPTRDPGRRDRAQPDGRGARRRAARGDRPVRQPRRRCRRTAAGSRLAAADRAARRQACRAPALRDHRRRPAAHRPCQCRARRSAARSPSCPGSPTRSARVICCRRRSCRAANGRAYCCRRRWRCRRPNCRSPRWSTMPRGTRSRACRSAACRATTRPHCRSTWSPGGSATATAMSSWSTISLRVASGDGWLHALFRYRHRASGHAAETSFGAHVFNTILTYRDEPQSYSGRPPGLSTRLFLRLGDGRLRHAVPPDLSGVAAVAIRPARPRSSCTTARGSRSPAPLLAIPCSGSRLFRYHALFDEAARAAPGAGAYAVIRDPTCRLFGYHGLIRPGRRLQPRPYVRILTAALGDGRGAVVAVQKNGIVRCPIDRSRGK